VPKWMRLPSTRDESLFYRMGSSIENGPEGNGPVANLLAWTGCLGAVILILALFGGIILSPLIVAWLVFF
jgi:hypothetical protein